LPVFRLYRLIDPEGKSRKHREQARVGVDDEVEIRRLVEIEVL
jgi:hypothetical protein